MPIRRKALIGSSPAIGGQTNPTVQSAMMDLYGQTAKAVANPSLSFSQTQRSAGQASRLAGLTSAVQAAQPQKAQTLTDFVKESFAAAPQRKTSLQAGTEAVNRVYDRSGLEADMGRLANQRQSGVNMAVQQALGRARRENNLARMNAGGAGASYLDRAYGDTAARYAADAAIQDADLRRDDLRYLTGQRMSNLGANERLTREYLLDNMLPYDAINQAQQGDARTLRELAALEDSNSVYETPEQQIQRRLGLINTLDYLGEETAPDPNDPSVILSRMTPEQQRAWMHEQFIRQARAKGQMGVNDLGNFDINLAGQYQAPAPGVFVGGRRV